MTSIFHGLDVPGKKESNSIVTRIEKIRDKMTLIENEAERQLIDCDALHNGTQSLIERISLLF